MAEPHDPGLLAQISGGLALILGWFWTMLGGQRKKLDNLAEKINDHEKRVLKDYPSRPEMYDALDKTVVPIHNKLDDITQTLGDIKKSTERRKDEEIERLRKELDSRQH